MATAGHSALLPSYSTDSLRHFGAPTGDTRRLLEEVRLDLQAMRPFLDEREECGRLLTGDHWEGEMDDPAQPGRTVKEKDVIKGRGQVPWTMNHVSPTIRQLIGQYLANRSERAVFAVDKPSDEAAEMMTLAMRHVRREGDVKEVEADQLLELLVGGMAVWKSGSEYDPETDRNRILIDAVDVERFFYTRTATGRRLKGLTRIGEIHDVEIDELVEQLATTREAEEELRAIYGQVREAGVGHSYPTDADDVRRGLDRTAATLDADLPGSLCRVIELWSLESRPVRDALDPVTGVRAEIDWTDAEIVVENEARAEAGAPPLDVTWRRERTWVCYMLSPQGHVLRRVERPYWHGEHPYTVGYGMYWRGRAWGLVRDIRDPQRLINRLTIAIDQLIAGSSKGLMFIDQETLDESGITLDEATTTITRFNGVLALKLKPGKRWDDVAKQVTANAVPSEVFNWLGAQKTWIEELSGVNGAMLGQAPQSGTPAVMYGMQQQASTQTTSVFFDGHFRTLARADRKLLKVILQFYDRPVALQDEGSQGFVRYEPEQVRDADYDVVIGDTNDTATYRQLFEADIQTWLQGGHLTFRQAMEASSHPRANTVMRIIDRTNALLKDQSAIDSADPNLVAGLMAAAQAGDREAATLLMQAGQAPAPQGAAPQSVPTSALSRQGRQPVLQP